MVTGKRAGLGSGLLLIGSLVLNAMPAAAQQSGDDQTCAERLTRQLRRYSVKCLSDLIGYVASQPEMGARVSGESEKYSILLVKDAKGFRAEAVSQFNFPMMKDETAATLKRLGWMPPENESDNWKKPISAENTGAAAEDMARALEAYGLKKGEAISLTVGTKLSK